jgi:hypothetical protein
MKGSDSTCSRTHGDARRKVPYRREHCGGACGQRLGWQDDVVDVCGSNQSFDLVGGWKAGLEQQ